MIFDILSNVFVLPKHYDCVIEVVELENYEEDMAKPKFVCYFAMGNKSIKEQNTFFLKAS